MKVKWENYFNKKRKLESSLKSKSHSLRNLIRKGILRKKFLLSFYLVKFILAEFRAELWFKMSGADQKSQFSIPNYYQYLVESGIFVNETILYFNSYFLFTPDCKKIN